MSIVNRRNAVLGWGVWQIGKRLGKRKIRNAPTARLAVVGGVLAGGAVAGGYVAARRFA